MADGERSGHNGGDSHDTATDRLNSWKDIASYLGKGVRTVQRWESHLGLPVRRVDPESAHSVFALKSEIDVWLLNGGRDRETAHHPDPPDSADPSLGPAPRIAVEPVPKPPETSGRATASPGFTAPGLWLALILVGVVGVVLSVVPSARNLTRPSGGPNPVGAAFEAGVLRTWNADGQTVWTIPLAASPDARLDTRLSPRSPSQGRRIAVADLDGDASNEVLILGTSPSGADDKLYVFNADGRPRFTHVPGRPVTFGSDVFRGFGANGFYLFHEPDQALSLWLTASNVPWFPSVLQQLSPRGEVLSEYWSNGHLVSLRSVTLRGRPFLLLGGFNNERHGASLAIIDRAQADGAAPSENPKYRCMDCPAGEPAEFLVFPGSDVMKEGTAGQGSAAVSDMLLAGEDDLVLTVHQFSTRVPGQTDSVEASLNYTLSAKDLSLRRLVVLWGYEVVHRSFERAGRLHHSLGSAEEAELARVLRWSRGRFVRLDESAGDRALARDLPPITGRPGS
jgi:hypothetical protein